MEDHRKLISKIDSSYEVISSKAKKIYEEAFTARQYIDKVTKKVKSKGTSAFINDNFQGAPVGGGLNTVLKVLDDIDTQLLYAQTSLRHVYSNPEESYARKQLTDAIRHLGNLDKLITSGRSNEVLGLLGILLKNLDVIKNMPSFAKAKKNAESLLKIYDSL